MPRVLPQIDSLTLKKDEITLLDNLIGTIPAAHSSQLIDFIRLTNHKRTTEKKLAEEAEKKKQEADKEIASLT